MSQRKGVNNDASILFKSDLNSVFPGDSRSYFSSTFKLNSYQHHAKRSVSANLFLQIITCLLSILWNLSPKTPM